MKSKRFYLHKVNLVSVALFTLCASCTVGPDFHSPEPLPIKKYTAYPLESKTEATQGQLGIAQKFVMNKAVPAKWWELFQSPPLNNLVIEALKNNPNINSLKATLNQARENFNAQSGSALPQIGLNGSVAGTQFAPATYGFGNFPTTAFALYSASLSISYDLDFFGGLHRQIEGYAALAQYQDYELDAAELILIGNVTTSSFKAASISAQIKTTNEIIKKQEELVAIAKKQVMSGGLVLAYPDKTPLKSSEITLFITPLKASVAPSIPLGSVASASNKISGFSPRSSFRVKSTGILTIN